MSGEKARIPSLDELAREAAQAGVPPSDDEPIEIPDDPTLEEVLESVGTRIGKPEDEESHDDTPKEDTFDKPEPEEE